MGTRVDAVRVEVDLNNPEFAPTHGWGGWTEKFELPPDEPLVAALLEWNRERLRKLALAAGQAQIDLG